MNHHFTLASAMRTLIENPLPFGVKNGQRRGDVTDAEVSDFYRVRKHFERSNSRIRNFEVYANHIFPWPGVGGVRLDETRFAVEPFSPGFSNFADFSDFRASSTDA